MLIQKIKKKFYLLIILILYEKQFLLKNLKIFFETKIFLKIHKNFCFIETLKLKILFFSLLLKIKKLNKYYYLKFKY